MQEKNSLTAQFSARFAEAMRSSGLKQKELAKNVNITEQTISRYKRGTRLPDTEELFRLAIFLGVSIDWLLGRDETTGSDADKVLAENIELNAKLKIAIGTLRGALDTLEK